MTAQTDPQEEAQPQDTGQDTAEPWWKRIDLGILITIIIIVHTLASTYISFATSNLSEEAGDLDTRGVQAGYNASDAKTATYFTAFQHYRAFIDYAVNNGFARLYEEELAKVRGLDPQAEAALQVKKDEAVQLAMDSRAFFPAKYLLPDGTYNIRRELNELWAEEALKRDLYPEPHYTQSDDLGGFVQSINNPVAVMTAFMYLLLAAANALHEERKKARRVCVALAGGLTFFIIVFYIARIGTLG